MHTVNRYTKLVPYRCAHTCIAPDSSRRAHLGRTQRHLLVGPDRLRQSDGDHPLDLAVPDRVPDLGRRVVLRRAVLDAHQPRRPVDDDATRPVLEPAAPVDVEDVLRHETVEEAEVGQRHVAVGRQIEAQLGAQVEHFAVEHGVHRRRRYFRDDVVQIPARNDDRLSTTSRPNNALKHYLTTVYST